MSPRYSLQVSRTSNMCPSTYMYIRIQVDGDMTHVADNTLPGNMMPWCKRGFTHTTEILVSQEVYINFGQTACHTHCS